MTALSSKLRAARKAAALTQGQVAARLAAVRTPCEASTAWSSYPDTIDYAPAPVGVAFLQHRIFLLTCVSSLDILAIIESTPTTGREQQTSEPERTPR